MRIEARARRLTLAGALAAALSASAAEGDFLTPFVGVSTRYDDNLFRLSDDTDTALVLGDSHRADWSRVAIAGVGIDWQPGRQRITANLAANDQTFDRFDFLDNTGFDTRARWQMAAGRRFTGQTDASYRRSLGSFDDFRSPKKDLQDTPRLDQKLAYLITPDIELTAQGGLARTRHDLATRQQSDIETHYWAAGASHLSPLGNKIGVELRRDTGSYPDRNFTPLSLVDNGYRQRSASLTGTWQGGFTKLDGKIGYSWRRFDHLDQRDYSGLAGELRLRHAISARLAVDLEAHRRLESLDDLLSSSVIDTGVLVRPTWAYSDRLSFSLESDFRDRQFQDSGLFAGADQPQERIYANALNASYKPRAFVTLTAGLDQGRRASDRTGFDYDYKAVNLSLQLEL